MQGRTVFIRELWPRFCSFSGRVQRPERSIIRYFDIAYFNYCTYMYSWSVMNVNRLVYYLVTSNYHWSSANYRNSGSHRSHQKHMFIQIPSGWWNPLLVYSYMYRSNGACYRCLWILILYLLQKSPKSILYHFSNFGRKISCLLFVSYLLYSNKIQWKIIFSE